MNKTVVAQPAKATTFSPPAHGILQRKCACGTHTMGGGQCADCAKKKSGLQRKLAIGASHDPLEREADRVADQVMAASTHSSVNGAPLHIQRYSGQANGQRDAAPASVDRTLAGSGRPLDTALAQEMGQRFDHDFSQVRVHTGQVAEQSAQDVNSHAYTVGHNIVFDAGQFAPSTSHGQWLIAHELAHVLQQHSTDAPQVMRKPAKQSAPTMGTMPQGRAQPATAADRREFALMAASFLEGQGEFFALQRDRDTTEVLGHLRTTANNALVTIANDAGSGPIADRVRTAYSAAVRTILVSRTVAQPNAVRTPPTLQQLYERHRDDILPFALPQSRADIGADELSAELSTDLPRDATRTQRTRHVAIQAARQRLRVITAQVDTSIADLFSTQGGTTTIPLPANTTARLSSTIPATLHRGLQSLAAQLMNSPLTANTTVMLALDLTEFGGGYDAYRFTRLDLGTLGTEILIERQGSIGIEGLTTQQRTRLRERFDRVGFRRSGFSQDEFDQVLIGLGEIPEAQLSALGALRIERAANDSLHPDAAAHYDQAAHTVRIFDRAYSGGMTRMGRAGRPLQFAAHAVAHEVGHALDLSSLHTTAAATTAAQNALLAEFGTGGTNFEIPDPRDPRRARFDVLNTGVTRATAAERAARSRSGARWTTGNPAEVTDDLAARARQPAFRQAAVFDGGGTRRMPTDYPNPESVWQEYFADSFSLYQTSPDLLRRIRPNVYRFMEQEFPR